MSLNQPESTFRQQENELPQQGWRQQQSIPILTQLQWQSQQPAVQSYPPQFY